MNARWFRLGLAGLVAVSLGTLTGCSEEKPADTTAPQATAPAQTTAPGATGAPNGTATPVASAATVTDGKQDLKEAVCVVCAADGKPHGPEAVQASIEYKGKGYYFCNELEKAEFISNPTKYAKSPP
jgi:YHS domain-containing protein